MSKSIDVIVALREDLSSFQDAVKALVAAGLTVRKEMPALHAVAGSIKSDRLTDLRAVEGVEEVELDGQVEIMS